jgi:hypothetical protein
MRGGASRLIVCAAFALVLGWAGGVFAQPLPTIPTAPPLTTAPPVPATAPPLLSADAPTVFTDTGERAIPGSLLDDFGQEYEARKGLRSYTWRGTALTVFPNTLLWEPPLAVKRDPRMMFLISDLKNYRSNYTVDATIGGTQSILRLQPEGADFAIQADIFGVVNTRLSPDDLMLADYRFGLPISWKRGWWHGKVGYEHTSAHFGDEFIAAGQTNVVPSWSKDELVIGLGRYFGDEQNLRVYGHIGYAFQFVVPGVEDTGANRTRYDIGFEWFYRRPTGFTGTPFFAANFEWRGDQDNETNINVQAGWLWRNPFVREGMFRVFAEHYSGRSPYGQIFRTRESFTSFGIAFDY